MRAAAWALVALLAPSPAAARFECRVEVVAATGTPAPDRAAAGRAAFRAWEAAASARFGRPYRWLLAQELPDQPEIAAQGGGFVAIARAHPCIAAPGTPAGACAGQTEARAAEAAGCAVFHPLGR
jgi:hypothetical protein